MSEWEIRKAKSKEELQIVACITQAYAPYRNSIADLPPVAEGIADDMENNHVWVVVSADMVIGVLILVATPPKLKLANLAVHPGYGGKGVGKALISHAERCARELQCSQIDLNTHADMAGNINLYQRLGWQVTARQGKTVSMSKSL